MFDTYASTTTERDKQSTRLKIDKDGNVGIELDPSYKLDISGGALQIGTNNTYSNKCIIIANNNNNGVDIEAFDFNDDTTKKTLNLNPYGGNVGIGTNDPDTLLHLHKDTTGPSAPLGSEDAGNKVRLKITGIAEWSSPVLNYMKILVMNQ